MGTLIQAQQVKRMAKIMMHKVAGRRHVGWHIYCFAWCRISDTNKVMKKVHRFQA